MCLGRKLGVGELDKGQNQLPHSCSLQLLLLLGLSLRTPHLLSPPLLAQLTLAYPLGLGACGIFSRKHSLIPFPFCAWVCCFLPSSMLLSPQLDSLYLFIYPSWLGCIHGAELGLRVCLP